MSKLTKLEQELRAGRLSRRDFLQAATVLGFGAVAPTILSRPAHAAPKQGGKFTAGIGHGSTTDSLDPGTYENDFIIGTAFARFNYLTEIDNQGNLIGELAESWDFSPDAKVWTFKLRSGVEYHTGGTMTAEDVVNSFNHHRGEESTSAAKPIVDPIVDIKADGDGVVVFTLEAGNADFPFLVSDYHIPILPMKDGKLDWASGTGTGAYIMQSYEPGVRMTMKKNPNYWKEGRGHFDEFEMITIADVAARTNALNTGEIHMMDRCDIKTLHLLQRNKNVVVEETSGNGHYTIPMRTKIAPFDDNNIRLALKYGLDREAMLQTVLGGHGSVGNDHPIGRGQRYYASELEQRTYDPDKCKYYLKQAGLDSLEVDISSSDAAFAGAVDAAQLYKEHAAKGGITLNVKREPADGYWSDVWNNDNRGWCFSYWGGRSTEDWMFSTAYAEGAEWNESDWSHEKFNELLVAARSELDETKRRDMYVEMQTICSNEGGAVVPVFNNYIHATTTDIAHDESMATNWANDGQRYMERWWFA